jgi:hypothetical protein
MILPMNFIDDNQRKARKQVLSKAGFYLIRCPESQRGDLREDVCIETTAIMR